MKTKNLKEANLKERGQGVKFERIRRVTGYLGTVNRFNDAKQAEVRDRLVHAKG